MKKIPSLFVRDYESEGHPLTRNVTPGCEWVIAGEGVATRKWDGTCCMIRNRSFYKRYDVKKGRSVPSNFIPAQEPDPITGHWPGWLPVGFGPEDRYFREAYDASLPDGTYELVGPKIGGNPEGYPVHTLIPHGKHEVDAPRDFDGLKDWLSTAGIEGVVWWHPDGRKAKIKAKDFGIKRMS